MICQSLSNNLTIKQTKQANKVTKSHLFINKRSLWVLNFFVSSNCSLFYHFLELEYICTGLEKFTVWFQRQWCTSVLKLSTHTCVWNWFFSCALHPANYFCILPGNVRFFTVYYNLCFKYTFEFQYSWFNEQSVGVSSILHYNMNNSWCFFLQNNQWSYVYKYVSFIVIYVSCHSVLYL